ncbi:Pentatricopeptide repeat-containing protein [Vitis vinifera]|uniref:Pentatricopeptide repeat-containing protein n=1 Tax=Vitis vinifera TaxID=29760 RepID=A0A438HWW0_VITVI|nr:Pentatricopeptide repeat-containing protein [Vitis vinifera]
MAESRIILQLRDRFSKKFQLQIRRTLPHQWQNRWIPPYHYWMRLLPTIATFTTLMHRFYRDAKIAEALKLKGVMELCGLKLDVVAYNVLTMDGEKLLTDLQKRGDISWGGSTQHLDKELTVAMGKLNYISCALGLVLLSTTTEWTITTVTPWQDLQVQNDLLQSDPHFQDVRVKSPILPDSPLINCALQTVAFAFDQHCWTQKVFELHHSSCCIIQRLGGFR